MRLTLEIGIMNDVGLVENKLLGGIGTGSGHGQEEREGERAPVNMRGPSAIGRT